MQIILKQAGNAKISESWTKNAYSQELSGQLINQDGWKVDLAIGSKLRFNDWLNTTCAVDLLTPKFFGC